MKLTVIPSDNLIILNGKPVQFSFAAPDTLHAMHYDGTTIRQELLNDKGLYEENSTDSSIVQPFIDAVTAELARLDAIVPPEPTQAEKAQQRITEIQSLLTANDLASVRPLRAKLAGTSTDFDDNRLVELEEQAQALRAELVTLSAVV